MTFTFIDGCTEYIFRFISIRSKHYVDICYFNLDSIGYAASSWIHMIDKNGKLILRQDHDQQIFKLSDAAINHIERIFKLNVFW